MEMLLMNTNTPFRNHQNIIGVALAVESVVAIGLVVGNATALPAGKDIYPPEEKAVERDIDPPEEKLVEKGIDPPEETAVKDTNLPIISINPSCKH